MFEKYKHISESIWYKFLYYGLEFLGRYYSTYRGFVIDNNDPEGLNRVKVICPSLIKNDSGNWAFSKGQWGSKGFGVQLLPNIGDMVYIEFDHGDLDYPIWQHAGYGKNEKPLEFEKPNTYGFITPNKTKILISDEKEGFINITYKDGSYINIKDGTLESDSEIINLGKDSKYKAVRGEKNSDVLEAICDKLDSLIEVFSSHTHSGDNIVANNIAQAQIISNEIKNIKTTIPQTLSNKINLE